MASTLRATEQLEDYTLVSYAKRAGDTVRADEAVALFEMDGRELPLLAGTDGVFLRALIKPGLRVGEGAPIAIVGEPGENIGWDVGAVRSVRLSSGIARSWHCGTQAPG